VMATVVAAIMHSPDPGCRIPAVVRVELAKAGTLRVAERALLLHHLLGNLHLHDTRVSDAEERGRFLGLMAGRQTLHTWQTHTHAHAHTHARIHTRMHATNHRGLLNPILVICNP